MLLFIDDVVIYEVYDKDNDDDGSSYNDTICNGCHGSNSYFSKF